MERPTHLLLVEDNPGDALLLKSQLFDREHYEIESATTLLEAEHALTQKPADLVLLDLSLPDSSGLDTLDRMHAAAPGVPIVVLTGVPDEEVAMAAVRRGAQDYLIKGRVDARLLARVIRHAIDRKQAEVSLRESHNDLERRVLERTKELRQANRTLQMIGECNQALVHMTDEEKLAAEICRIICDVGGYAMACVAFLENDAAGSARVIACSGPAEAVLGQEAIGGMGADGERNPMRRAMRRNSGCICRDLLSDPDSASWHEIALAAGLGSAISLPLASDGRSFGALNIFAQERDAFDQISAAMLSGLGDDLAFGINALRAREQRDRAERGLALRAEQLRALALQLSQAEQRERRRLAQSLHDNLQQLLVGAKYQLGAIRSHTKSKAVIEAAEQMGDTLKEAIEATRTLTAELSPPILHEKSLSAGLERLARQMQEKYGLRVWVEADSSVEPTSDALRVFLFDAVRELLFNIVKHSGVDRAIVRLSRREDELKLEVSDAGIGFNPDVEIGRDGTVGGFGLFSVRERLGFLGGRIAIESAPSNGTRITLFAKIPAPAETRDAVAEIPMPAPAAVQDQGGKIRVLLADDHAIVRQGLRSLLQGEPDMEVVYEASDGREAVEMTRRLQPDVVIMDIDMPGLNGCEATRIIVTECPRVRVVGLSMYSEREVGGELIRAGASAHLTKGGPAGALISAIRAQVVAKEPLSRK